MERRRFCRAGRRRLTYVGPADRRFHPDLVIARRRRPHVGHNLPAFTRRSPQEIHDRHRAGPTSRGGAGADAAAMDHLRHRRDRLRLRHLRNPDAPADRPAGAVPGSPEFQMWVGRLFYIPAFAGGIFGLLGGYLTDLFGRRRVLTFSILIYAVAAFASGFATSVEMLLVLRCFVFVGVCVEFVAAVAWLAELFPQPHQRERVLGYTQAFSSLGGLMVATANGLCVAYAANLPAIAGFGLDSGIADPHAAWRYTLMTGVIPAIPVILIRPFLPESPIWKAQRAA